MGWDRRVHCVQYTDSLPIDQHLMCVYWKHKLHASSSKVVMFLFVLNSCEHQAKRLEYFCVSLDSAKGSTGDRRVNIPQCILAPRSVYQTLLSIF